MGRPSNSPGPKPQNPTQSKKTFVLRAPLSPLHQRRRRRRRRPAAPENTAEAAFQSKLGFLRSLSSSIKPVSYPTKPPEPSSPGDAEGPSALTPEAPTPEPRSPRFGTLPRDQPSDDAAAGLRSWTRADIRFAKDSPAISPVSYAAKVAPLPEDLPSVPVSEEEGRQEAERRRLEEGGNDDLRREARRIQGNERAQSFFRAQQQEQEAPFPTLIRQEKRPQKTPMDLVEAIRQVKANSSHVKRNFLETVEAHANLGVDPRRGDQMVRGALTLPYGTGKTVRVAVFAEGAVANEAKSAGADIVGGDELIEEKKKKGGYKINFDKCIATPMFMPRLSKIAKILGPRGLMPNPKLGSVTSDVSAAVKAAKSGRIDFKIDKTAIVHVGLGKVNFSEEAIRENVGAFVNALLLAKPVGLKKTSKYAGYVKSFTLCSTMGPGFPVTIQSLSAAADSFTKLQVK